MINITARDNAYQDKDALPGTVQQLRERIVVVMTVYVPEEYHECLKVQFADKEVHTT